VAPVAQVRVSQDLLDAQPDGLRLEDDNPAVPGIHHRSAWVDDCIGPSGPQHVDANRQGFAALHALYTWLHCSNDQQFLYTASTDSVISVDHSPFLPNGPGGWTKEALDAAPPPIPDPILSGIGLVPSDFILVLETLQQLTIDALAEPVARLPDEWGVDDEDRLSLLNYLVTRREAVVDLLP
jgi:hypothetical protein